MGSRRAWAVRCGTNSAILAYVALFALIQRGLLATPWAWIAPFCALLLFIGLAPPDGVGHYADVPVTYFALLAMVVLTVLVHAASASWQRIAISVGAVVLICFVRAWVDNVNAWARRRFPAPVVQRRISDE
jgi:hypothetical protein